MIRSSQPCFAGADLRTRREGFTILELLVVIGILGLLLALLLPAVQSSRAASRKAECSSHLRALGVAVQSHESAKGHLPRGLYLKVELLPFLGRAALHDLRNSIGERLRFRTASIPEYQCPADGGPGIIKSETGLPATVANYAGCYASHPLVKGRDGAFGGRGATSNVLASVKVSQITDGLSNTALISELLRANGEKTRLRAVWFNPTKFESDNPEGLTRECDSVPLDPLALGWFGDELRKGFAWYSGDHGRGLYNHVLTPNRPSCNNGGWVPMGAYTASSNHRGGVNVLFADGHIQFFSEGVDLKVWRELASRSRL